MFQPGSSSKRIQAAAAGAQLSPNKTFVPTAAFSESTREVEPATVRLLMVFSPPTQLRGCSNPVQKNRVYSNTYLTVLLAVLHLRTQSPNPLSIGSVGTLLKLAVFAVVPQIGHLHR